MPGLWAPVVGQISGLVGVQHMRQDDQPQTLQEGQNMQTCYWCGKRLRSKHSIKIGAGEKCCKRYGTPKRLFERAEEMNVQDMQKLRELIRQELDEINAPKTSELPPMIGFALCKQMFPANEFNKLTGIFAQVAGEYAAAIKQHPETLNSMHEGHNVIREEIEECAAAMVTVMNHWQKALEGGIWSQVRLQEHARDFDAIRSELHDIIITCLHFEMDLIPSVWG
jgi:hypothetical protein